MKNIINRILTLLFLILVAEGCTKEILDKAPLDIISDAQVWDDPKLVSSYLTNLYDRSKMSGLFRGPLPYYEPPTWSCFENIYSDEGTTNYDWEYPIFIQGLVTGQGDAASDYWNYSLIRDINDFLIKIETGSVEVEVKEQYIAQARFLRAFAYFHMVKRFGGVPIVLTPQSIDADSATLYVKRNTEKEVYDLIANECDAISSILPEVYSADNLGRTSKYAALAMKSRAMLYAASIAKYGTVQLDGLVGIPASDADEYWQASLDASKAIINSGQFELFNNYPEDKAKNYQYIWLDEDNSEIILAKKFIPKLYGTTIDDIMNPNFNYSFWGCQYSPSMEMVDSYEMKDGSSGAIDWANVTGDLTEIFKNKDPRFEASILYNGQQWAWDTIRIWYGIYTETGEFKNSETELYQGMDEVGRDKKTGQGPKSGFLMKKFLDPSLKYPKEYDGGQDWIEFRYAEILLNYAEASFELGNTGDALNAVNQIRTRAGIATLTTITLDQIRHERKIEMAFELQRFWDLRRWRIAQTITPGDLKGVFPMYHFDTTPNRWEYEVGNCEPFTRIFKPYYYYFPLGEWKINNNPNLVENPDYN